MMTVIVMVTPPVYTQCLSDVSGIMVCPLTTLSYARLL